MGENNKTPIISEIRRLYRKREPLNISAVKRRHPELIAAVYAMKPFWGWKKALADAGIAYSEIEVELQDHCTCQICGHEATILTFHLLKVHGTTPADYRKEFPGAVILCEVNCAARLQAKPAIPHWEPIWTWEYVLDRIRAFYELGYPVSNSAMALTERPLYSHVWHNGRQWDEVLLGIGLDPKEIRIMDVRKPLSKSGVIKALKARFKSGMSIAYSRVAKTDMRLANAAKRNFGSFSKALEAAGFDPKLSLLRVHKVTNADLEALRLEMLHVASLPWNERPEAARKLKKSKASLVFNKLGNWTQACEKFGIDKDLLSPFPYINQDEVVAGIRHWAQRPDASIIVIYAEDRSLAASAYRLFGSWKAAMAAAGVSFSNGRRASKAAE